MPRTPSRQVLSCLGHARAALAAAARGTPSLPCAAAPLPPACGAAACEPSPAASTRGWADPARPGSAPAPPPPPLPQRLLPAPVSFRSALALVSPPAGSVVAQQPRGWPAGWASWWVTGRTLATLPVEGGREGGGHLLCCAAPHHRLPRPPSPPTLAPAWPLPEKTVVKPLLCGVGLRLFPALISASRSELSPVGDIMLKDLVPEGRQEGQ